MGDLPFFVSPPPDTAARQAAATEPEPSAAATGYARPRCRRRVQFRDLVASPTIWFPPSPPAHADDNDAMTDPPPDTETAVKSELEDRMDLLWEDFNEELLAMRRACSTAGGGPRHHGLWPSTESSSSSDGDDESDSRAPGAVGCFPVLRPSARAGGAGHYRRRHAGATWVLLMRIFGRLFVVDKTAVSAARRRHAHATTSSARI